MHPMEAIEPEINSKPWLEVLLFFQFHNQIELIRIPWNTRLQGFSTIEFTGEGDDDNSSFLLENDILYNNTVIDYQTQSEFTIRVASTDEANNSFEEAFKLFVSQSTLAEFGKTDADSYTLYPNPTSGSVRIKGKGDSSKFLAVLLVDLSGKVLFS